MQFVLVLQYGLCEKTVFSGLCFPTGFKLCLKLVTLYGDFFRMAGVFSVAKGILWLMNHGNYKIDGKI